MSKVCSICDKSSRMFGRRKKAMSKYNPTPKSRKYPNLQWATLNSGKRIKICAKCLKKNRHLKYDSTS